MVYDLRDPRHKIIFTEAPMPRNLPPLRGWNRRVRPRVGESTGSGFRGENMREGIQDCQRDAGAQASTPKSTTSAAQALGSREPKRADATAQLAPKRGQWTVRLLESKRLRWE